MLVFLHFPSKTVSFFIFRALKNKTKQKQKQKNATRVFTFLRSVAEGNITIYLFWPYNRYSTELVYLCLSWIHSCTNPAFSDPMSYLHCGLLVLWLMASSSSSLLYYCCQPLLLLLSFSASLSSSVDHKLVPKKKIYIFFIHGHVWQ